MSSAGWKHLFHRLKKGQVDWGRKAANAVAHVVLALPERRWVTVLGRVPVVSVSFYGGSVMYSRGDMISRLFKSESWRVGMLVHTVALALGGQSKEIESLEPAWLYKETLCHKHLISLK